MRAVFLDGDGTAFLSEERNRRAIERVAREGGFSIDSETFWNIPSGDAGSGDERVWHMITGEPFAFAGFKDVYPDTDAFQEAVDAAYMASMAGLAVNQPILDLTNRWLQAGIIVGGASNARRSVFEANLRHTGYPIDRFSTLVGKDDVLRSGQKIKPSPAPFLMAMHQTNDVLSVRGIAPLSPEECVGLEDSCTGAKASLAAGFYTVHLSHESGPLPDRDITDKDRYLYISPEELLRLCSRSSILGQVCKFVPG